MVSSCSEHPYLTVALGLIAGAGTYWILSRAQVVSFCSRAAISATVPVTTLLATVLAARQKGSDFRQKLQEALIPRLQVQDTASNIWDIVAGSYSLHVSRPNFDLPDQRWEVTFETQTGMESELATFVSSYATDFGVRNHHPITISLSEEELSGGDPLEIFEQKLRQFLQTDPPVLRFRLEQIPDAMRSIPMVAQSIRDLEAVIDSPDPISEAGLALLRSLENWHKDVMDLFNPVKTKQVAVSRLMIHKPDACTFDACFEGVETLSRADMLQASVEWTDTAGVKKSLSMKEVLNWQADQLRSHLNVNSSHNI